MSDTTKITFRKLTEEDLHLMHIWLNEPHVHDWYDKDKQNTLEEVKNRYSPKIQGNQPTDCYIVLYDKNPLGYIQTYKVNDWPEFGDYVGYDDKTASVDLFIGESDFMGRGLGSLMLHKFVTEVVFAAPNVDTCIIGPEPDNKRAIHVYEKAGFKYIKTIQIPNENQPTYIMELKKD